MVMKVGDGGDGDGNGDGQRTTRLDTSYVKAEITTDINLALVTPHMTNAQPYPS